MTAIFRDGIFIYGLSFWRKTKVTLSELTTLPPFLRFDEVSVCLRGALSIEEKCEFIGSKLLPLKSALVDSNVVKFYAIISGNRNHFSDHSQFLEFVQTRLLSNCGSSRSYKFEIYFKSDEQLATSAIASLLKMNEIKRSSRIKIEIEMFHRGDKHLPVEEISNWLENPSDGMENIAQIKKERFLEVDFDISCTIQNAREMVDHLKEVFFRLKK